MELKFKGLTLAKIMFAVAMITTTVGVGLDNVWARLVFITLGMGLFYSHGYIKGFVAALKKFQEEMEAAAEAFQKLQEEEGTTEDFSKVELIKKTTTEKPSA
jgi:hypothetical protein